MSTLLLHRLSGAPVFLGGQGWPVALWGSALTRLPLHEEQLLSAAASLHFSELNDREENENHFPIIYGIGK